MINLYQNRLHEIIQQVNSGFFIDYADRGSVDATFTKTQADTGFLKPKVIIMSQYQQV